MTQMPDPPAFLLRSAPGTQPFKHEPPVAALTSKTQAAIATTWKDPIMTAPTTAQTAPKATRKPRQDVYRTIVTITVDMKKPETVRAAMDAGEKLAAMDFQIPAGSTVHVESAFGKLSAE